MRVMVLVKGNADTEAGTLPTTEELEQMGAFNEELAKAGIILAAEGLHSSAKGKQVRFDESGTSVLDGPFAEAKEVVAGFWLWQVSSMDEAVEWIKRAPFQNTAIELRQVFEAEDFGDALTPELREAEDRLRAGQ
jgi:hypothetical protein